MKKLIQLLSLSIFFLPNLAQAQKSHSFDYLLILNNFDMRLGSNFDNSSENRIFGIMLIKKISDKSAWRFGLGYKNFYQTFETREKASNDTLYEFTTNRSTALPHLTIGKEWRKIIHKDVLLVGGIDFSLGGGPGELAEREYALFQNERTLRDLKIQKDGLGFYTNVSPFTGLRINWGRLALGYDLNASWENIATTGQSTFYNLDLTLRQALSIGIKLNEVKSTSK